MWEKREMKILKWALLGSAAIAVTASGAQADDLNALKAQLEALQARVTQLEAQPQAALPSGYSLITFRKGSGVYDTLPMKQSDRISLGPDSGYTISIMPTADVAPVAEITISGEIRTVLEYGHPGKRFGFMTADGDLATDPGDFTQDKESLDVHARGRLVVRGRMDTAVGEVGGQFRLQGGDFFDVNGSDAAMNQAFGWWKFAPAWKFTAGEVPDSAAAIQAGPDWDFTGPHTTGLITDNGTETMPLEWNNGGPITAVIAIEDSESTNFANGFVHASHHVNSDVDVGDIPAVAGYLAYDSGHTFLQIAGLWERDDSREGGPFTEGEVGDVPFNSDFCGGADEKCSDNWWIGGGARFGLGDRVSLTGAAAYSEGYQRGTAVTIGPDDKYWAAGAGIIFKIGEHSRIEAGAEYFDNQDVDEEDERQGFTKTAWDATAGWFWEPVSQVTIGVAGGYRNQRVVVGDEHTDANEVEHEDFEKKNENDWNIKLITYLRF